MTPEIAPAALSAFRLFSSLFVISPPSTAFMWYNHGFELFICSYFLTPFHELESPYSLAPFINTNGF